MKKPHVLLLEREASNSSNCVDSAVDCSATSATSAAILKESESDHFTTSTPSALYDVRTLDAIERLNCLG